MQKEKSGRKSLIFSILAEAEGFEPPDPCGSTVFKTAAIDHSATPPERIAKLERFFYFGKRQKREVISLP